MAPRKSSATANSPSSTTATSSLKQSAASKHTTTKASTSRRDAAVSWDAVIQNIYTHYMHKTAQRTKLIDLFLVFLVLVGGLQFAYCVLAGNYPFNAFLSGFSAAVGQFVLAMSLRIQTATADKTEFPSVSPERAFADFVVCSLILHFFCVNFIN